MKKILILLAIAFSWAILTNCDSNNNINCISEEGDRIEKSFEVPEFTGITVANHAKVYVSQSEQQELTIEAHESIMDNLLVYVNGNTLVIEDDKCTNQNTAIIVNVKTPYINQISLSGAGEIALKPFDNFDDLNITLSGSGDIYSVGDTLLLEKMITTISGSGNLEMYLDANELQFILSGSGNIIPRGNANMQSFILSGSGNYYGYDLLCKATNINISGSGMCQVHTLEELDVTISGSGSVYYRGYPTIKSNISGSGSIIDSN